MEQTPSSARLHPRSLVHNSLSYAGFVIAFLTFMLIAFLLVIDFFSPSGSAYFGIVAYLILPPFLVLGLVLVPIGMGLENRRRRQKSAAEAALLPPFPRIDLNQPRHQRLFAAWAAGTVAILAVLGVVAYQSYEYMDSTTFCGDVCHTVMQPEKTAYDDSPHARVNCTACHIGPGASWFVKSKISGVYQVYAVLTNTYPRPITTPIENLRPARETCEQCHWPEKFYGDMIVTHTRYQADEKNTETKTSLVVKTGGGSERAGVSMGIHWHMDPRNEVDYIATDQQRQNIPWVSARGPDGKVTEYVSTDSKLTPDEVKATDKRQMDCIDCHNRPTHIYYKPDEAVDREISAGRIDRSLPFAKKEAVALITAKYGSQAEADKAIADGWDKYYRDNYPQVYSSQKAAVDRAGAAVVEAYDRNVFPEMNVGWGTYVDNIGHQDSAGCFRCHDGKHVSADGRKIRNDCGICHTLPVQGEPTGIQVAATSQPASAAPAQPAPSGQPAASTQSAQSGQPTQPAQPTPALPAAANRPGTPGGLHNKTTHANTPCQTCHQGGAPGTDAGKPTRDNCTACHADRKDHNPGVPCQTCHSFTS